MLCLAIREKYLAFVHGRSVAIWPLERLGFVVVHRGKRICIRLVGVAEKGSSSFLIGLSASAYMVTCPSHLPNLSPAVMCAGKALEMGYRSIAITTLAQYELIERRKHIIGRWNGQRWERGWVWDGEIGLGGRLRKVGVTPDWRIIYYQFKKGANLRDFDLTAVQRLLGLIQETPKEQRTGAIIVCEDTGQPWKLRAYQEKFREIAREAGVPDYIFSMDMRSGGASEAGVIEAVSDRELRDGGGWTDAAMMERYRRTKPINAQKVVEHRQQHRKQVANETGSQVGTKNRNE